jgi:hypothetical protein
MNQPLPIARKTTKMTKLHAVSAAASAAITLGLSLCAAPALSSTLDDTVDTINFYKNLKANGVSWGCREQLVGGSSGPGNANTAKFFWAIRDRGEADVYVGYQTPGKLVSPPSYKVNADGSKSYVPALVTMPFVSGTANTNYNNIGRDKHTVWRSIENGFEVGVYSGWGRPNWLGYNIWQSNKLTDAAGKISMSWTTKGSGSRGSPGGVTYGGASTGGGSYAWSYNRPNTVGDFTDASGAPSIYPALPEGYPAATLANALNAASKGDTSQMITTPVIAISIGGSPFPDQTGRILMGFMISSSKVWWGDGPSNFAAATMPDKSGTVASLPASAGLNMWCISSDATANGAWNAVKGM